METVTLDSYWVGDGLDVGEVILFEGVASQYSAVGFVGLGQEVFFRSFTLDQGFGIEHFLDGSAQGRIVVDLQGDPLPPPTTATFERLVFTFEGEGTEVPEPGSLLLFGSGILAGVGKLQQRGRAQRRAPQPRPLPSGWLAAHAGVAT